MADSVLKMANTQTKAGGNSRRAKFVKLAESRTVNAIKAIRTIGKLGNRNAYEYSEADVKKIVRALTSEIEDMKTRLTGTKSSDDVDFKL